MSPYTIQVEGFPEETDVDAVRDFFTRVGDVASCTVKGTVATLSFGNQDDFNEALKMDGIEFDDGFIIRVEEKEVQQQQVQQEAAHADHDRANGANLAEGADAVPRESRKRFREEFKVAVRHLGENTTEQHLRELFEPLGTISDFFLEPRRRYAFIGFDNADSLESALQMSGREVNGIAIEVERKRTGPREKVLECKVVAKGLPPHATEETIRAFFSPAGEATDVFIHDKKQFAFIGFPDEQSCNAALQLNGQELDGHRLEIERRQRQRCFKCNREGHVALQCHAVDQACRNCGRPGHIARDCRMAPRENDGRNNYNNHHHYHQHHQHHNNNNYHNDRRKDYDRRDYDRRDYDKRDYDKRDYDKRDYDRRDDKRGNYERRRVRSRSDSYERHHRRRSRSPKRSIREREDDRSRSPKRFVRERDGSRSRSPPRRRY